MPALSDDIFRFLWDGTLLANDINPYGLLPADALQAYPYLFNEDAYNSLNSPDYYTVYPPVNQYLFALAALVGKEHLLATNVLRMILLVGELVSYWLLARLVRHPKATLAYWLNPLIIIEICGNLHFEGLIVTGLLSFVYFFKKGKWISGFFLAMAVAIKLLPLIYLPSVIFRKKTVWSIKFISIFLAVLIFSSIPLISIELVQGMASSLDLYVRSFEFNASTYYVLRAIGYWITGYNEIHVIGPTLAIATFVGIMILSWKYRNAQLETVMLICLTLYLLLSTTVHPWYIIPLVPLGLISGFYYPIIWSCAVFVSYFGYTKQGYELPVVWIGTEYLILAASMAIDSYLYLFKPESRIGNWDKNIVSKKRV